MDITLVDKDIILLVGWYFGDLAPYHWKLSLVMESISRQHCLWFTKVGSWWFMDWRLLMIWQGFVLESHVGAAVLLRAADFGYCEGHIFEDWLKFRRSVCFEALKVKEWWNEVLLSLQIRYIFAIYAFIVRREGNSIELAYFT